MAITPKSGESFMITLAHKLTTVIIPVSSHVNICDLSDRVCDAGNPVVEHLAVDTVKNLVLEWLLNHAPGPREVTEHLQFLYNLKKFLSDELKHSSVDKDLFTRNNVDHSNTLSRSFKAPFVAGFEAAVQAMLVIANSQILEFVCSK